LVVDKIIDLDNQYATSAGREKLPEHIVIYG